MKKMFLALFAVLFLLPGYVSADGCQFVDIASADLQVKATTQRAILWQRGGVWEIHIMPVFERYRAKAAWVVPFPVQPDVQVSSSDFFNQLEILTAPMFIEACIEGGGCGDGIGPPNSSGTGRGQVEIWDQGTVGELDYVVITAEHQISMVNWLRSNGYYVTDLAEASLTKFETEGTFFFAAKLSKDVDPDKPVSPVRFVLPDLSAPVYPLVLTGLGVPDGTSLALSVWVVSPGTDYYVPTSHGYDILPQDLKNVEEYDTALRRFYLTHRAGTLAMLAQNVLANNDRINRMVCVDYTCVPFSEMGIAAPEKWCAEIEEIVAGKDRVARFQGRLGPVNLKADLTFELLTGNSGRYLLENTYLYNNCDPDEEEPGPCGDGD